MQSLKAMNSYFYPIDFKRGSIQVFDFADSFEIENEKAYLEVFNFIKDFPEIIKSSKDLDLAKKALELNEILRANKIPLKDLYDRLFFNWFCTSESNTIAKNRNKFKIRFLSVLTMPFTIINFPLNYFEFLKKYNDESFHGFLFRNKYENFKNNRVFTLKMIMYLMILIRCLMSSPLEIKFISTLLKSPYGDLFDYLKKKKSYSDFLSFYSKDLERFNEMEYKFISSELNKINQKMTKESDKINEIFEKLNNSMPIDETF